MNRQNRPRPSRTLPCRTLLGLGLLFWAAPAGLAADGSLLKAMEEEIASLMEKNRSCVVSIQTIAQRQVDLGQNASGVVTAFRNVGSGVIFDAQGHILTTAEVVRGADHIQVSLSSGRVVDADLVATDEDSKLAVIRLRGKVSRCPRFGNSDRIRTGHYAFIIGNAYGTMAPSVGTVAEFHDDDDLIQISGSARPGNSGAAVFNSEGLVVGIVRGVLMPSPQEPPPDPALLDAPEWNAVPATLLAIPINRAQEIARRLISGGWLGVEVERHGITAISRVVEGGPAHGAGLRPGDVIVSYNGVKVIDGAHLKRLVMETPAGMEVQVSLLRDEGPLAVQVRLGQPPGQAPQRTPPPMVYDAARRVSPETPEMLLQRLRDLELQMQMLMQQREGKKEK